MKDEDKTKAQLIDELKAMRQKGAALEAEASARNQTAEELEKQVAALRRSAGTLRTLQTILDSIGDGVVVADENGKFLLWNPAAEQIVGIGPTDTSPDEWTEQYGAFEPDMVTPRPTNEHALVRAIRGEAVDEAEVFLRNPKVPEGIWVSAVRPPTVAAGTSRIRISLQSGPKTKNCKMTTGSILTLCSRRFVKLLGIPKKRVLAERSIMIN